MAGRRIIGVMSGTSCDGVDAALVDVDGRGETLRGTFRHLTSLPYSDDDRRRIRAVRQGPVTIDAVARVGHFVAERYAACVLQLLSEERLNAGEVTAVAAHGQTLFHAPPVTYQAFDPAALAAGVGIDVVSDFRRADCAAGGQGAPLVPFGDWVLFRAAAPRVLVNVGGISNVTVLPADAGLADVVGYDVGPGNCLSDWLMREHGGLDAGGALARTGRPLPDVVDVVLADAFFAAAGPKSTDTPAMLRLFEAALARRPGASLPDRLATANAVVARSIVAEVRKVEGAEVYVAGGGVLNGCLMDYLDRDLGEVRPTDALGVPAQAREAVAFALLGAAHLDRFPCHMPRVTGATRAVVLGSLTPGR